MEQTKLIVRMPRELHTQLKIVSVRESKSITEIVNGLVTSYVNAKGGAA